MDFELPPEDDPRRVEIRRWLDEHPRPSGRDVAVAGLVAPHWPRPWGLDADPIHQLIIDEELRRSGVARPVNPIGIGWAGPTIIHAGSDEQKERYLPGILSGEEIWCQLFSEPNAGSDLASLQSTAQRIDGEYVLNGQKIWSSGAHWSSFGILVARTDPSGPRYRNLSFFLLDMSLPGVEVRPITQITGERDFCEVFFTDVRMPASAIVAEEGMGWQVAVHTLLNERIGLSGGGGMHRMVAQAWEGLLRAARSMTRNGTPAIEDPRVRQRIADVYVASVCNRWTALRTLDAVFKGQMPGPQASILKLASDAWVQKVNDVAGQIVGLHAVAMDEPRAFDEGAWARGLLYSRAMSIGGGTTEVQKNIVGERVLGLPRDAKPGPARK